MRNLRFLWLALLMVIIPASSFAGVFVSVNIAPPVLPVYEQPLCPGDGYIWTPGYWAYGPEGYFWVPGTWVTPPTVGVLWTPGYWGWGNGVYIWHGGYWGPHIGFYGGVNYGFGYFGHGYEGGYWRDRHFYYNRTVNNVNITNVHIYNKTVINNVTVNRISYNGGHGGIDARPTHDQERWSREHHFEPTHMQRDHETGAGRNREFLATENHGRPSVAATSRPGEFHGPRVVPARADRGSYRVRKTTRVTIAPCRGRKATRATITPCSGKRCAAAAMTCAVGTMRRNPTTTLAATKLPVPATIVPRTPPPATAEEDVKTTRPVRTGVAMTTQLLTATQVSMTTAVLVPMEVSTKTRLIRTVALTKITAATRGPVKPREIRNQKLET